MVYEDGGFKTSYTYGANGRISQMTRHLEDEINPVTGKTISTTANAKGENINSDIAVEKLGKLYYHLDRLGSTAFITDESGMVRSYATYDEWGNVREGGSHDVNIASIDATAGFTTYTYDKILDKYFAQYRMYDAENRRFTAEDPIKDGLNWYNYVANRPLVAVDPWGLDWAIRPSGTWNDTSSSSTTTPNDNNRQADAWNPYAPSLVREPQKVADSVDDLQGAVFLFDGAEEVLAGTYMALANVVISAGEGIVEIAGQIEGPGGVMATVLIGIPTHNSREAYNEHLEFLEGSLDDPNTFYLSKSIADLITQSVKTTAEVAGIIELTLATGGLFAGTGGGMIMSSISEVMISVSTLSQACVAVGGAAAGSAIITDALQKAILDGTGSGNPGSIKTGDKTPKGREFSKHAAERANTRDFSAKHVDEVIDNWTNKYYQSGGKTVYAKKYGHGYDVVIVDANSTSIVTCVGGKTQSLPDVNAVLKMLHSTGGYSFTPIS